MMNLSIMKSLVFQYLFKFLVFSELFLANGNEKNNIENRFNIKLKFLKN